MYGYIYLTTNLINNKKYIGQHKSDIFDINYYGSGKLLQQAINKEGIENFKCEVLCECFSEEDLNLKEAYYIKLYDAVNSSEFYNLVPGGYGRSIIGTIYITNGECNKKILPEDLDHYLEIGWRRGGPKPSSETIEKRRNSNIGKKHKGGENISKSLIGRNLSEQHKAKLSKAKLGKTSSTKGRISVIKGDIACKILPEKLEEYLANGFKLGTKKHTNPDSAAKHSAAMKDRTYITDGTQVKHVLNAELAKYLAEGWIIGKKIK